MTSVARILIAALISVATSMAQEPPAPETMDEGAVLARLRLLTQEELEISRLAAKQAGSERVRAFAREVAQEAATLDQRLTQIAGDKGVSAPAPGSKPLFQRLEVIKKLRGEEFDPDYLKLLNDFHGEHIALYERLAKAGKAAEVREFARKALAAERAHQKEIEKLAAPLVPIKRVETKEKP